MHGVTISELIKKMKLKNTTPEIDSGQDCAERIGCEPSRHCNSQDSLIILTGQVQIIGYVEQAYINTMDQEQKRRMYDSSHPARFHVWCSAATRSRMRTFWNSVITMAFPALCLIRPPLP